jgi:hypothetical protein
VQSEKQILRFAQDDDKLDDKLLYRGGRVVSGRATNVARPPPMPPRLTAPLESAGFVDGEARNSPRPNDVPAGCALITALPRRAMTGSVAVATTTESSRPRDAAPDGTNATGGSGLTRPSVGERLRGTEPTRDERCLITAPARL